MFAYLLEKLNNWFESAERTRREAYLASSLDVNPLSGYSLVTDRRLRAISGS